MPEIMSTPKRSRRTTAVRAVSGLALLATLGAACGRGGGDSAVKVTPAAATADHAAHEALGATANPVDSGASALRSGLTALLQEHVYLAGIAVTQGVGKGLDSAEFKAAAGALDKNSVGLADAITSVYGQAAGDQFLALWRKHIGFFVDYTKGKATKDDAIVAKAKTDLDGYRNDFGAFIASANPNLPKQAVADELLPHIQTLFAAIDAVVAGDASAFDKLRTAAEHMPMTADILAGGIAKQYADKFPGGVDSSASALRSGLTSQLQEHVYLAGIAVVYGVNKGLDSGEFKAAAATLDKNSVALSESIASVYGQAAGTQFLALWRKHIGFFVDYTKGEATKDAALTNKAKTDLDGYRADFGAFIASANPNLPKQAVADELIPHVQSLFDAIDVVTGAKQGDPFELLRVAAAHMPMTADVLAGGIAKQFPAKFSSSGTAIAPTMASDLPRTE
jgi:cytochrome c556